MINRNNINRNNFLAILFIIPSLIAITPQQPITPPAIKRAIIFDMDGTLVSSEEAKTNAWVEAFKFYGINLTTEELSTYAGEAASTVKNSIEKKHNITLPDAIILKTNEIYDSWHSKKVKPIDAAVSLVKHLYANKNKYNISLAVASASRKKEIFKSLQIAGIDQCFDLVVSGRDDLQKYTSPQGTNKPQPYVYLETARRLGVPSWNCIAFEDSRPGAESALQAGMHVFAIPTNRTILQFNDAHYNHRVTFLKSAAEFDIDRYLASQVKIAHQKSLDHNAIK